jgi:hypothetical protein
MHNLLDLPLPGLEPTLDMFLQSRKAVGLTEEIAQLEIAIDDFRSKAGPVLQDRIRDHYSSGTLQADTHENKLSLAYRKPIYLAYTYFFGHLVDRAPKHGQLDRTAVIAAAALAFRDLLMAGEMAVNCLETFVDTSIQRWLFNTTRIPGVGVDAVSHASSRSIIVLRRGHIFRITCDLKCDLNNVVQLRSVLGEIMEKSEEPIPAISSMTSDDREIWAHHYNELEAHSHENRANLKAIADAAFVVCLDDMSPETPSDRCNEFLGNNSQLINRWNDKTLQFVVAANGTSATIGEHTKVDGLTHGPLLEYLQRAIWNFSNPFVEKSSSTNFVTEELHFSLTEAALARIGHLQATFRTMMVPIECRDIRINDLAPQTFSSLGYSPKAGAMLTALLALTLCNTDLFPRPVWETVSLSSFKNGRIDWIQVVSLETWHFLKNAINDIDPTTLKGLWDAAVNDHTKTIGLASRGYGFVNRLYALQSAILPGEPVPPLFESKSWQATARNGLEQAVKLDCTPPGNSSVYSHFQEAGFMMQGENPYFVHYHFEQDCLFVSVQTNVGFADRFLECLEQATKIITRLIVSRNDNL